jgi:hypothetical protein
MNYSEAKDWLYDFVATLDRYLAVKGTAEEEPDPLVTAEVFVAIIQMLMRHEAQLEYVLQRLHPIDPDGGAA